MIRSVYFLLSLLAGTTNPLSQQAPPPDARTPAAAPAIQEVTPGIFEYNGIRLDKKNHRISFPATVNQRQGLIEYLLVNEKGKVHESLFSTKVLPHDIQLALLLIGLKADANANPNESVPPAAIDTPYLQSAPKLKGPPVLISVICTQNGKSQEVPADNWIFNLQTNRSMTPGSWTYNGSMIQDGVFLADQESSIVAVVTDPTALVNNPREGYDNDEIWQVQEKAVPPLDTPIEFSITLVEPSAVKP
ncbi:MAG: YdjY domain-containing protein [Methylacidiphilales bacterium]|nr:YdjY domain-containing protein [Candidatus Methylacidiphilales bacterium]